MSVNAKLLSIGSRFITILFIIVSIISSGLRGWSAEWQWSIPVKGGVDKKGPSRAFLWIPPNCQKLRGVVLAQHNMEEIHILENAKFRQALSELGLAEIWCIPSFDHYFRFNEGAGETFNGIMEDLAKESGYEELKYAPVIGIGHSAAASWPYYFAVWNPDRTLVAISVSGQWPYFRNEFAPDIWGDRTFDLVPALVTMGEYEWADTRSDEGLKQRRQHPKMPLSMLAAPAEGHFEASEKKIEYIAFYIKKVMQYRLPDETPADGPPKLKPIDPSKSGWLVDKWRKTKEPTAPAASVDQYKGDPKQAFWFFDEEMAKATEEYQAAYRGLKGDLIGYMQAGEIVPQTDTHQQVNLKFLPEADGVTFKLTAEFLDKVPGESGRPAKWTGIKAGSPINHASGGGPISIDRICGPFEKLAPDTFVFRQSRICLANPSQPLDLWFVATQRGDDNYKPAVQQAQMRISKNKNGKEQHIDFPEISDQPADTQSVKLGATADSGEKVYYYVQAGPAEVDGDTLKLLPIPLRAKYPIKITVVAWQWGRANEPKLKTADPVERSFYLTK
jgi:hypothetical protein